MTTTPATSPRMLRRVIGVAGVAAVIAATVVWSPAPSNAATTSKVSAGAWMKPGVPLNGQQHPDPSVVTVGPLMLSFSTEHGGADLPSAWSADGLTWTARTEYGDDRKYLDGDRSGYYNDSIVSPPWGVNSCVETRSNKSSCDPKTLWAPGMALIGDTWNGYHAVKVSNGYSSYGRFAIYRTTSAGALGDYRSTSASSMVSSDKKKDPAGVIDPEVFTDPGTGKVYLLWKTEGGAGGNYPKLWSRQLNSTGSAFASGSKARQLLTVTPGSWEGKVIENPSMIKVDGKYVLFYSGNDYSTTKYATAHAICTGPLGPCKKSGRLITSTSGSYGPGGPDAVIDDQGRYLLAYHAFPRQSGGRGYDGRTPRTAEFAIVGGKVKILQREIAASPGTKDGIWWGGADGDATRFTGQAYSLTSSRIPFVTDLDGDRTDDLGLYGTWSASDASLTISPDRTIRATGDGQIGQAGTFVPVSGDFNGDGRTDVFWYQPGADPSFQKAEAYPRSDQLWLATAGGGWDKQNVSQERTAIPVVGDFDGNGADELWWVAPGRASDEKWAWNGRTGTFSRSSASFTANWVTSPAVGDFDGDSRDDIMWVAPGAAKATVWWRGDARAATQMSVGTETQVYGRKAVAGDFNGDGRDEVLWYGLRGRVDAVWSGIAPGTAGKSERVTLSQDGSYTPRVGDFDGDGADDIFWTG